MGIGCGGTRGEAEVRALSWREETLFLADREHHSQAVCDDHDCVVHIPGKRFVPMIE